MSATEDASFTSNPLNENGAANTRVLAELDIEAALKAGTLTESQAIVQQERLRKAMETKIAELEARLGAHGVPVEAAVRSVVARLTESPSNWHQGVVFGLVANDAKDAELRMWAPVGLVVSGAIVSMQCAVAVVLFVGTISPACADNDQCGLGLFCRKVNNRCTFCGQNAPLTMVTEGACTVSGEVWTGVELTVKDAACTTHNFPPDPNFVGFNSSGVAAACADPSLSRWGEERSDHVLAWCDKWCEVARSLPSPLVISVAQRSCPCLRAASIRQLETWTRSQVLA